MDVVGADAGVLDVLVVARALQLEAEGLGEADGSELAGAVVHHLGGAEHA